MNREYIKVEDCVDRGLYRISSRNLVYGVYCATSNGFIGIRMKFENQYLFTEFHWDAGEPFGTVCPLKFIEMCPLTDIRESEDTFDEKTNRLVAFDKPIADGGKGWYYLDTGEVSQNIRPTSRTNQPLFDWLKKKELEQKHEPE
jgi:hypothetical protein